MIPKPVRQLISHLPRGQGMAGRFISRHLPSAEVFEMIGPLHGLRMHLDTADPLQVQMSCGAYQPELIKELSRMVRPGDVVLTAGAHVGYMMLAMANMGARVIGFECDPRLLEVCQQNLALNSLNATLVPVGLGSEDSELEMNASSHPGLSSFSIPHYSESKVRVSVRRADDVLREMGLDRLDGLLIDVEGWECHLLAGLRETLLRSRPRWAIVECFEVALREAGSSAGELMEMLQGFGWKVSERNGDLICVE